MLALLVALPATAHAEEFKFVPNDGRETICKKAHAIPKMEKRRANFINGIYGG
ncbi:MAG: hypothetical protein IID53_04560 [Proteobacteria bacterium]|nr:hypothetical protein [Pseudomonadota bacterium]